MKMQQETLVRVSNLLCGFTALLLVCQTGCATIVSEKNYPVTINNSPGPTFFSVQDRKNNVIHQGITPQQVTLDAKAFPFWPAKYTVVYAGTESTTQRHEVKAGFDPWVAGNLLIGGGLGAVVDGATGAMFKLPKRVEGNVPAQYAVTDQQLGTLLAGNTPNATQSPGFVPRSTPGRQPNSVAATVMTDANSTHTPTPTPKVRMASSVK